MKRASNHQKVHFSIWITDQNSNAIQNGAQNVQLVDWNLDANQNPDYLVYNVESKPIQTMEEKKSSIHVMDGIVKL